MNGHRAVSNKSLFKTVVNLSYNYGFYGCRELVIYCQAGGVYLSFYIEQFDNEALLVKISTITHVKFNPNRYAPSIKHQHL